MFYITATKYYLLLSVLSSKKQFVQKKNTTVEQLNLSVFGNLVAFDLS